MSHFCLFASTPDVPYMKKVLTGTPDELARIAVDWGYDGIELLPNPERVPKEVEWKNALRSAGAVMPALNTGLMEARGMTLFHEDASVRRRSIEVFNQIPRFCR